MTDTITRLILTADLGTSGVRAALFDEAGELHGSQTASYAVSYSEQGFAEIDPEHVFQTFLETIRACLQKAPAPVESLVLGCFMHALTLVDESGKPLTPLSIWSDRRALPDCLELQPRYEREDWHGKTGCFLSPSYPIYRLLWFRRHEPEIFRSFSKALSLKAWLLFRLTGEFVEDVSSAGASGYLNLRSLEAEPAVLDALEIGPERLPRPVACEEPLELTPVIRGELGAGGAAGGRGQAPGASLTPDFRVIAGSTDGPLAHLGSAGRSPTAASLTIGTSGAVRLLRNSPPVAPTAGFWSYPAFKDFYISGRASNNGGNVLEWYAEHFMGDKKPGGINAEFERIVFGTAFEPELLFQPELFDERDSLQARGKGGASFQGLRSGHHEAALLRAVTEGVVFHLVDMLEKLVSGGEKLESVVLSGGITTSPFVQELIQALIDIPLMQYRESMAPLYGALGLVTEFTPKPESGIRKTNLSSEQKETYRQKFLLWKTVKTE